MKQSSESDPVIKREVARRRTFAIISHPDAGKTTLTEKLLLYGGCLEVAGSVRGRKTQRAATSDWMELEKQPGISVSSTVLPMEYAGYQINLLDTPGHHDFSEDTYRTLMAADCAVMVIDLAKGVEEQTEKLFRVCALRQIPVITFVNKVDRPGREPLEIMEEIESKLGIRAVPRNWPLGTGFDFCGVVDIASQQAHLFEDRNSGTRTPYRSASLEAIQREPGKEAIATQGQEEVELLRTAGEPFDSQRFLDGEITPVYFGSALTNYGVEHFLDGFLETCPAPCPRQSDRGEVAADRPQFGGLVFKIQANLDPRHRDRVAFVRVCSGRFRREMEVIHSRTGKKIRLRRAHRVFGHERETMDEAYAGDIIGLVNPGEFALGDTICEGEPLNYEGLPQFSPEFFATLRCPDVSRRKQFSRGLTQLIEEGTVQVFTDPQAKHGEPILAAVGELQFDVVRYRLETEYNTQTDLSWLPYEVARWPAAGLDRLRGLRLPYGAKLVRDQHGGTAILFRAQRDAVRWESEHDEVQLSQVRIDAPEPAASAESAAGGV